MKLSALVLIVLGVLTAGSPVLYAVIHPENKSFGVAGGFLLYLSVPAGAVLIIAGLIETAPPIARTMDVSRTHSSAGAVGFYLLWLAFSVLASIGAIVVSLLFGAAAEAAVNAAMVALAVFWVLLSAGLALAVLHAKRSLTSWPLLAIALCALPAALAGVTVLGLVPAAILTTRPVRGPAGAPPPAEPDVDPL